jgi:hypothetical protein
MRCFVRILDILGRRTDSGADHCGVVLEHRPTGTFLGVGAALAHDVIDALVFRTSAEAHELLTRFGCEPGDFSAVPVSEFALNVA